MRDELFKYYVELGHDLFYERAYYISARRIGNVRSGFLLIASAGSIATLSIWDRFPILWAAITLLAQLFQALQPLTQASKQRDALKYIIQEKNALFDEVSAYWNDVGNYEIPEALEADTRKKITEWKQRDSAIYSRFASDIDFPYKKRIESKAAKMNQRYFWYHHDAKPEEEIKL